MFKNDYSEACAPEVISALSLLGSEQNSGYGTDSHSARAEELILKTFGLKGKAKVHFLAGGTQANAVTLSYFLRPYEGVIACSSSHINGHETGAVEGTGHKIVTCPAYDGKLLANDVEDVLKLYKNEHSVHLRAVYISDSTETGTVYKKSELQNLREVCDRHNLLLYLDGARLGAALTVKGTDVDAPFIGMIADAFYVGGTKNGALFGEAVIIKNNLHSEDFRYHIKNRGAMLAKGFILGSQFEALFENGLYWRLAEHSNSAAAFIRDGLLNCGVNLVGSSVTNQIFLSVPRSLADKLICRYGLELWEDMGNFQTVRVVTSFMTKHSDCIEFIDYLKKEL